MQRLNLTKKIDLYTLCIYLYFLGKTDGNLNQYGHPDGDKFYMTNFNQHSEQALCPEATSHGFTRWADRQEYPLLLRLHRIINCGKLS